MSAPGPGVRLVGRRFRPYFYLALVADPDTGEEIKVGHDIRRRRPYRCQSCGYMPEPNCPHTFIAHQLITSRRKK